MVSQAVGVIFCIIGIMIVTTAMRSTDTVFQQQVLVFYALIGAVYLVGGALLCAIGQSNIGQRQIRKMLSEKLAPPEPAREVGSAIQPEPLSRHRRDVSSATTEETTPNNQVVCPKCGRSNPRVLMICNCGEPLPRVR